jgi:hypothetical protein
MAASAAVEVDQGDQQQMEQQDSSVPFTLAQQSRQRSRRTVRGIEPASAHHAREAAKHRAYSKAKAIVGVRAQTQQLARSGSEFAAKREQEAKVQASRERAQARKLKQAQAEAERLMAPVEEHVKSESKARWNRVNNLLKVAGDMPLTRPMGPPAPPPPVNKTLGFLASEGLDAWPNPEDCEPSDSEDEEEIRLAGGLTKKEREMAAQAKEENRAEPGTVEAALDALKEGLVENDGGVGVEAANYTRQFLLIEAAADRKRRRRRAEAGQTKPRPPPMSGGIAEAAAAQRAAAAAAKRQPTRVDFLTGKRVPIPQAKLEKPLKCGVANDLGRKGPSGSGGKITSGDAARRKEEAAFEVAKKAERTFAKGTRRAEDEKTTKAQAMWKKYVAMSRDSAATKAAKNASKAADRGELHGADRAEPSTANLWALLRGRIDAGMPLPAFEPPPPEPEWYPYRVRLADEAIARDRGVPIGELMDRDGPRDPDLVEAPAKPPKMTPEEAAAAEQDAIEAEARAARDECANLEAQLAAAEKQQRMLISASLAGAANNQAEQLASTLHSTTAENEALRAAVHALEAEADQAYRDDPEVQWASALRYAGEGEDSPLGFDALGDYYAEEFYGEEEVWVEPEAEPEAEPVEEEEEAWIYKEVEMVSEAVREPRWTHALPEETQAEHRSANPEQPELELDADALSAAHGAHVAMEPAQLLQVERAEEIGQDVLLREQLARVDAELARRAIAGDSDALGLQQLAAPAAPVNGGEWGEEWRPSGAPAPAPVAVAVVTAPRGEPGVAEQALRREREQRTEARERRAREREERLMRAAQQNGSGVG